MNKTIKIILYMFLYEVNIPPNLYEVRIYRCVNYIHFNIMSASIFLNLLSFPVKWKREFISKILF